MSFMFSCSCLNHKFLLSIAPVCLTESLTFHHNIKMEYPHHSAGIVFANLRMSFHQILRHSLPLMRGALDYPLLLPLWIHRHPIIMLNPTFHQTFLFECYPTGLVYITSILVASHYTHLMKHTTFPKLMTLLILLWNLPQPHTHGLRCMAPLFSQLRTQLVLLHMHPSSIYLYFFL